MRYKGKKSDLALIAKELGVRYVVDGTVQKQDNGVKITSQLVDTQTGKVLLSNEFQGTTDDVFALEEKLARSIAFELQGSLARTAVLDSNLIRQSTKNPEAYNKFLLGVGCLENVQTQVQLLKGIGYLEEALKLDPKFAYAQCVRALAYIGKYQASLDLRDLMIGDSLAKLTLQMDPSVVEAHLARMQIARMQGQTDSALQQANMLLEKQPDNISAHAFMGSIYYEKRDFYRAASHLERAVQKNITDLVSWSLLIDSYQAIGDTVKRNRFIDESIPLYELFLEKNPAIVSVRVHYALNLANRRLREKAHEQIAQVTKSTSIGPADYYNLACVYSQLGEAKPAIEMIKKTISLGNHPGPSLATDPDLINLHSNPEFKEIMKKEQVQKLTAE
jgi:tetratricopeptide (TPR) repeat protein